MNGGNPTSGKDRSEVTPYVVGTLPDANWRGYSFDFGSNFSPNGAIEYKSSVFNGALKGKLLVVRYSGGKDIIALTPDSLHKDIIHNAILSLGADKDTTKFSDPLDLTEDVRNGNIYVSEYGGSEGKIVLLKPSKVIVTAVKKTLYPIADAYLRNGDSAGVNYGIHDSLYIKNSATVRFNRSTFVKFKIDTSIKQVYGAVLRLYGKNVESFGSIKISAFGVTNDSWTERGITWNNAPASLTTPLGSVDCNNEEKYYDIDVTGFVKNQFSGDKTISLAIKNDSDQDKKVSFNSRENARNKPQLLLTIDTTRITSARAAITSMPNKMSPDRASCDDPSQAVIPADNTVHPLNVTNNFESPKVFPNPFRNRFNIQLSKKYQGKVTLQIVDLVGKTFEIGKYQLKPGGTNIDVNISNLSLRPGAYFLKINSEIRTEVMKLIVQ